MRLNNEEQTRGFITDNTDVFEACWNKAHNGGFADDAVFLWVVSEKEDDINYTALAREHASAVFNDLGHDAIADYQREQLTKPAGPAAAWLFIIQEYGTLSMRVRRLVKEPGAPS